MNINTPNIPIEDDPCDIIGKAMRGLGISREELAHMSNLSHEAVSAILAGNLDTEHLTKVAEPLQLSANALSNLSTYRPTISAPSGLHQVVSPFGHAGVNSYIISHGNSAIVFDTGTDVSLVFNTLKRNHLNAIAVFITHAHHDHISGVEKFKNVPILFPEDSAHGQEFEFGGIPLTSLNVSGHATPARAYFHDGLATPVCILGDCLFAGSMGGTTGPKNYQLAKRTIKENILSLPSNTVLATGHGPLTNLNMESIHNPFIT